jgi:hypothetical protein
MPISSKKMPIPLNMAAPLLIVKRQAATAQSNAIPAASGTSAIVINPEPIR